ncbi:actin-like protein Arp5p [Sistotremastrum niveocremeum HHB9708]|uniref:Actin-like protein Arp5p n=1 Tax=Sistotremastrum niveocremeum HHB9708 TaxID=1314777 RepID=A0A164R9R9_9AGAM|nr:actin-like protein Arp5p [Sistotremastrum niveocremeum HHB9708]
MTTNEPNVTALPLADQPTAKFPDSYDHYRGSKTPIIIDNGSTTLRFGFSTTPTPHCGPNVITKYKDRRTNRPVLLFGDAVELENNSRSQAKTPWEGDVLLNADALECSLDYAFLRLGIDTESVDHPVFMTERICSPLHSRALTSELLFEQYTVPNVAYCLDAMMSFYWNNRPLQESQQDGLVFSFNSASTSIIPVLGRKGILSHAKRIPWGAMQSADYLLKLVQLKYPTFSTRITTNHANWMYRTFCEFSDDYLAKLRRLKDPLEMQLAGRIVQFPYTATVEVEKTEEELARLAEKRKEQGRKLQEISARVRGEKLLQKENDLAYLTALREERATLGKREWTTKLQSEGFDTDAILDDSIKKLEQALNKARKKEIDGGGGEENVEPPSFPLLDTPDEELDEEQLKEKRKQRLAKAGYEARIRARKEKEREREERAAEEKKEEEERTRDLSGWSQKLRSEHEAAVLKIKDRNRRKAALSDRKSAVAQARMKSIASLANEEKVGRKKRKAGGDDMFGANDDDWAIYRKINIAAPSSDEEDDMAQLQTLEAKLLEHDPSFSTEHTYAAQITKRSALISAFRPSYEEGDTEGRNRVHLNVERWRVPETYFQPSIAGVDSAGLAEVAQMVLAAFSEAEKARLVKNVMVTGGPAQIPGLLPRLHASLRPLLAPEMELNVTAAADPSLDAWHGMAHFANMTDYTKIVVTKAEYDEYGGERVKKWWGGNWNAAV